MQTELRQSKSPSPRRRSPEDHYQHPHGDNDLCKSSGRNEPSTCKDSRDSRDRSRSPVSRDNRTQSPPSRRKPSPSPPISHTRHQPLTSTTHTVRHMHQDPRTTQSDMNHHLPPSSGHLSGDKIVLEMDVDEAGDSDDGRDSPIDIMGYGDTKDVKDGTINRSE